MFKRIIGILIAIGVLYGAAWIGAAFWLQAELQTALGNLSQRGYAFTYGETRFTGFPARVGLFVPGLSIAAPASEGGWRWQADRSEVSLHLSAPRAPVLDLAGTHRISGFMSGSTEGVSLKVGRGTAQLAFAQDQTLETIALDLGDTSMADAGGTTTILSAKEASVHISLTTGHVTVSARDLTPAQAVPILSPSIAALDLTVDFTGPLPAGPLQQSLEAWRAGGGAIELREFTLNWPPLQASGTGTLALDPGLQPMGAATMKFQGFLALVEALAQKGYVLDREAAMAKSVLGMMAKPSAGGEPELSIPLTVQDRRLSAGPLMLMEIPVVKWDENARVP